MEIMEENFLFSMQCDLCGQVAGSTSDPTEWKGQMYSTTVDSGGPIEVLSPAFRPVCC